MPLGALRTTLSDEAITKLLTSTQQNIARVYNDPAATDGDRASIDELLATRAWTELDDRFFRDIAFGTGGIIVGAVAHEENLYDGHALPEVLQQTEALTGSVPAVAIVDRGYRGARRIGETEILLPGPKPKDQIPQGILRNNESVVSAICFSCVEL